MPFIKLDIIINNGRPFPEGINKKGEYNKEKFYRKFGFLYCKKHKTKPHFEPPNNHNWDWSINCSECSKEAIQKHVDTGGRTFDSSSMSAAFKSNYK